MLIDTSGFLAFHHKDESCHLEAVRLFSEAVRRITHNYVLAEFVALSHVRKLPREKTLDFVADIHQSNSIEVYFVDELLHAQALELLHQRLDKSWSLCDAVSFLIMKSMTLTDALTTDHHFTQAGFRPLLKN